MAHFISIMKTYGRMATDPIKVDIDDLVKVVWSDPKYLGIAKGEGRLMAMGYNSKLDSLNSRSEDQFDRLDCIMIDCDGVRGPDGNIDTQALENFKRFAVAYRYILWETATSSPERPKFRVVIPMTRSVNWTGHTKKAIANLFRDWTDPKASWHEEPLTPKLNTLTVHDGKEFPAEVLERVQNRLNEDEKLQTEIDRQLRSINTYHQMTRSLYGEYRRPNMSTNEKVRHYLDTPYTKKCGNGDSDSGLYTAICVCLAANDEDTLNEVLNKARSENWSNRDLDRKIAQAKKFVSK